MRPRACSAAGPYGHGARIGPTGVGDHYPRITGACDRGRNGWAAGGILPCSRPRTFVAPAVPTRWKFALLSQGWVGGGPGATYLTRQVSYADAMRILLTDAALTHRKPYASISSMKSCRTSSY